ncbi:MAG: DUF1566 domain-containing protein [bacterium]
MRAAFWDSQLHRQFWWFGWARRFLVLNGVQLATRVVSERELQWLASQSVERLKHVGLSIRCVKDSGIISGKLKKLRFKPTKLSEDAVKSIVKRNGFFDRNYNPDVEGFDNNFELVERQGQKIVVDHATGLVWQQSGLLTYLRVVDKRLLNVKNRIAEVNEQNFAGYNDWRLPTLEEAMSLIEPRMNAAGLFISPIFSPTQFIILTADSEKTGFFGTGLYKPWIVLFIRGSCGRLYAGIDDSGAFVRLVRSEHDNL